MAGIPLFIAEPTGTCRLSLRRFRHRTSEGEHFHDTTVIIDENAPVTPDNPDGTKPITDHRVPRDDPRWPASCPCGEPFGPGDQWQVNELDWYQGPGGQLFAWGIGSWDGIPGAVMRTTWRDVDGRPPAWHVCLPNQAWWNTNDRSAPAQGETAFGPYWTVTGEPPNITVSPSIDDQSPSRPWHGWIRAGALESA